MAYATEIYFLSSGSWKSNIKVSAGLYSIEVSLLGLQMAAFLLHPHIGFLMYMCWREGVSSGGSYSYKDTSPIGLGPQPYATI